MRKAQALLLTGQVLSITHLLKTAFNVSFVQPVLPYAPISPNPLTAPNLPRRHRGLRVLCPNYALNF